jgi:hypothetical protein
MIRSSGGPPSMQFARARIAAPPNADWAVRTVVSGDVVCSAMGHLVDAPVDIVVSMQALHELLKTASEVAGRLQALGDDLIEEFVEPCRHTGRSWGDIGTALGVTRQAAQQRFLAPFREYGPEEISDELRTAYVSIKTVAVLHHNNYIGTEHVLYGLLSDDNSATASLTALAVSPSQLRDTLEKRLRLGASLAADRIAWTPYARRAAALAKDIATEHGWAQVRCDHFLAGLVQLGRGVAAELLAATGINEDDLRGQMKAPKSAVPQPPDDTPTISGQRRDLVVGPRKAQRQQALIATTVVLPGTGITLARLADLCSLDLGWAMGKIDGRQSADIRLIVLMEQSTKVLRPSRNVEGPDRNWRNWRRLASPQTG